MDEEINLFAKDFKDLSIKIEGNEIYIDTHIVGRISLEIDKIQFFYPANVVENLVVKAYMLGYTQGKNDLQYDIKDSLGFIKHIPLQ